MDESLTEYSIRYSMLYGIRNMKEGYLIMFFVESLLCLLASLFLSKCLIEWLGITSIIQFFLCFIFTLGGCIGLAYLWRRICMHNNYSKKSIVIVSAAMSLWMFLLCAGSIISPKVVANITVTATGEKNKFSNQSIVLISSISDEDNELPVENIKYGQGWSYIAEYNDYKYYSETNTPSDISFELVYDAEVEIHFYCDSWSGYADINVDGKHASLDLYQEEPTEYVYSIPYARPAITPIKIVLCFGLFSILFMLFRFFLSMAWQMIATSGLKNKRAWTASIVAVLHWGVTFFTDTTVFSYTDKNTILVSMKAILLLILLLAWNLVFCIKELVKQKSCLHSMWLKCFTFYFSFMVVLIFITWPGNWIWDDIFTYNSALSLDFDYWQHYITSVYYILSLMLIPTAGGIIIIQNLLISAIVGYVVASTYNAFHRSKWSLLMFLPFFMPPVLWHNLYPIRLSLYSFFELLLITEFVLLFYGKKRITYLSTCLLSFLTAIIAIWRTEGIYYMIWAPVVFIVIMYHRKRQETSTRYPAKKYALLYLLLVVSCSGLLMVPQYYGTNVLNPLSSMRYSLSAYMEPLIALIKHADSPDDSELIEEIDDVINVDQLLQFDDGESAFWSPNLLRPDHSQEDFPEMQHSIIKLILKHPGTFLHNRIEMLSKSVFDSKTIKGAADIFTSSTPGHVDFVSKHADNTNMIPQIRYDFLLFLMGKAVGQQSIRNLWCLLVPLGYILLCGLYLLIRRKWALSLICSLATIRIVLLFLTIPATYFMYFLSSYLCGYAGLSLIVIWYITVYKKRSRVGK